MALLFLSGVGALAAFNLVAQRPWVGTWESRYNADKEDKEADKPDQWDTPGTNVQEHAVNPSKPHHGKKHGVNLMGTTNRKAGNHWKGT